MRAIVANAESILRACDDDSELRLWPMARRLAASVILFGVGYGFVMGSFGGVAGAQVWQMLYSGVKVPLLLLGTFTLCLPSYFVLNTVAGVRSDFGRVLRALLATQAAMTVILLSLAPFTALWYFSTANYHSAILMNGAAFAVASLAAQTVLRRLYRPLIQRDRKHLVLLRFWLFLYVFVGIQLGWLLRPFVGQPDSGVQLFRDNAWGNAYVEVFHHLTQWFR